jgi:hypothetical protein
VEAEAPEAVTFCWKQKRKDLKICRFSFHSVSKLLFKFGRFLLTRSYLIQIFFDVYLNHLQIIITFLNNDVKYFIINCITTFQKKKLNWKQFQKQKHFRKRLLSAGSGSAGSGSA